MTVKGKTNKALISRVLNEKRNQLKELKRSKNNQPVHKNATVVLCSYVVYYYDHRI